LLEPDPIEIGPMRDEARFKDPRSIVLCGEHEHAAGFQMIYPW